MTNDCRSGLAERLHVFAVLFRISGNGRLQLCRQNKRIDPRPRNPLAKGVWRNGSASDSRSEGWEFESLCPQFSFPHGKSIILYAIK